MPDMCLSVCDKNGANCVTGCIEHSNARTTQIHDNRNEGITIPNSNPYGRSSIPRINDVINVLNNQPQPTNIETNSVISAADKAIRASNISNDQTKSHLTDFQTAVLIGLGIALAPEAIVAAGSSILTALTIGPVAEVMTLELLANPAFMQAASRAGAILGGGKLLNIFGVFKATRREIPLTEHPLKGWAVEQVVQHANILGLQTPRDSLILWSGLGKGNIGVKLSQEFASKNGGMTLEMTLGGKWLDQMGLFEANSPFSREQAHMIWEQVSVLTIRNGSGQVRAVTGQIHPDSIYNEELREILTNKNITGLDDLSLKPRVVFK